MDTLLTVNVVQGVFITTSIKRKSNVYPNLMDSVKRKCNCSIRSWIPLIKNSTVSVSPSTFTSHNYNHKMEIQCIPQLKILCSKQSMLSVTHITYYSTRATLYVSSLRHYALLLLSRLKNHAIKTRQSQTKERSRSKVLIL